MDTIALFLATKLHIVVVVAAVLMFLYVKQKRVLLQVTVLTLPLAFAVSKIANIFIENPRPFVDGHVSALIQHAPDNGFPSDHTLLAVTLGMILYTQNKLVGGIFVALGMLVGVGRVLVGVHHVADVVGSIVIALVATYCSVFILRQWWL